MTPPEGNAVTRWFGSHFQTLHPVLQDLHVHGGRLRGVVRIRTGRGVAAWLGRRLANSIGAPVDRPSRGFEVNIRHTECALHWDRRFEGAGEMKSTFIPVGTWPHGYWYEDTRALQLRLSVDTAGGAWQWRPLRAYLHGIRLPLRWLPRSRAGKRVEGGRYIFEVEFALPLLGHVLSYGGELEALPDRTPS